jgi:hypothetical protein
MARLKRFSWQNFNLGLIAFALSPHLSEKFKALYRVALNLQLAAMRKRLHLRRLFLPPFRLSVAALLKKALKQEWRQARSCEAMLRLSIGS